MSRFERNFLQFVEKHIAVLGLAALLFLSVALRWSLIPYGSTDYLEFLRPWYEEIRAGGGLGALQNKIGDYNYPYLFLFALFSYIPVPTIAVKSLSLVFDYVGAAGGAYLVWTLLAERPAVSRQTRRFYACAAALILLFFPTVLLNAAVWGQCDFMYVSCLLFSLAFFWRERYFPAFIWYGAAFAFKLQAVFLLPVLLIFYLYRRRFSILYFLLIPATLYALSLPVVIIRWPATGPAALLEPVLVYLEQTEAYLYTTMNMPNIYSFVSGLEFSVGNAHIADAYAYFRLAGILFTLAVLGGAALFILAKRYRFDGKSFLLLCIFSIYTCVMFLPSMHERYGFGATVLMVLYLVLYKELGAWFVAYFFVECSTYVSALTDLSHLPREYLCAYVNLAVYLRIAARLLRLLSAVPAREGRPA